jgi:plastocyanin domain-containing protein
VYNFVINRKMAKHKKQNNKKDLIILFLGFVIGIGVLILLMGGSGGKSSSLGAATSDADGSQLIEVNVKGGYSPGRIDAKANTATTLRMKSLGTYGCERAFSIPKLGISKMLPSSGDTDIAIPAQAAGTTLVGTCSMGMYTFSINFN